MTENKDESQDWLARITDGGLPQVLAGPAGKAISRLIGAGVEIPAAYLEGIAQGIRDKSEARSQISQAIAKQAASKAIDDPEVMQRAMYNMLERSYRTQKNKDAVAKVAVEDLIDRPPTVDSEGPSDDWMTKFERYAEDASSDELRAMFGKLLAGEAREPGTISQSTMHFVSMLDGETAKLIERVLPSCTIAGIALFETLNPKLSVAELSFIEQAGFWSADKTFNVKLDSQGVAIRLVDIAYNGFAIRGTPNTVVRFKAGLLSRAGADLVRIVSRPFDFEALADEALQKDDVTNFYYGRVEQEDDTFSIPNPIERVKGAI